MRLSLIAIIMTVSASFSLVATAAESTESSIPVLTNVKPEVEAEVKAETTEAKDTRKESEIALNLEANKKATAGDNTAFRVFFSLAMVGLLGGGVFWFLKKYAVPKGMKSQTQIKVLQQHYLGPKKSLAIVRVAGESILIGVTDSNITMIKSLSLLDDEVPEETPATFSKILSSAKNETTKDDSRDDGEDFSFGGIKDKVSKRLRGMRDLE